MTRSDTLARRNTLQRLRDAELVLSVFRSHAGRLFPAGATPRAIVGWRLFPLRGGGFAVSYDVDLGGDRPTGVWGTVGDEGEAGTTASAARELCELSLRVFEPHEDPRLVQLATILSAGGPEHGEASPRHLVAYRPLARAVVRIDLGGGRTRYLRVSASRSRYARVRELAEQSRGWNHEASSYGTVFPRVIGVDERLRAVLIEGVDGELLHQCIDGVDDEWLDQFAATVATLHGSTCPLLPVHQALDEAEATSWMLRRGAMSLPAGLAGAERDLARLFDAAPAIPLARPVPIHRDLHDKQALRHRGGAVVLLDTDTLASGDPALDLANLAVHFELRGLQGRLPSERSAHLVQRFAAAYGERRGSPPVRNLAYYSACSWLRLAGVYALRSHGQDLVPLLLRRGRAALDRLADLDSGSARANRADQP